MTFTLTAPVDNVVELHPAPKPAAPPVLLEGDLYTRLVSGAKFTPADIKRDPRSEMQWQRQLPGRALSVEAWQALEDEADAHAAEHGAASINQCRRWLRMWREAVRLGLEVDDGAALFDGDDEPTVLGRRLATFASRGTPTSKGLAVARLVGCAA